MKLIPVDPIGTKEVMAFWDGHDEHGNPTGGFGPVTQHVYPKSHRGEAVRSLRVSLGLSLRQVCSALQVSAFELSGLEQGRFTFDAEEAWGAYIASLHHLALCAKEEP